MLQKLFNTLIHSAMSREEKQLRNDVIMIVSLLAANSTKAPFVVITIIIIFTFTMCHCRRVSFLETSVKQQSFQMVHTAITIGRSECSFSLLFLDHDSSSNSAMATMSCDDEDFEMKKSLLCLLVTLSTLPAALKV